VAGLALLTATTNARAVEQTDARMNAMAQKMKVADLPAKSDGVFISAGSIRIRNGVLSSDKPVYAISRHSIVVLPNGGIKFGK
jgi:hypothetical protein